MRWLSRPEVLGVIINVLSTSNSDLCPVYETTCTCMKCTKGKLLSATESEHKVKSCTCKVCSLRATAIGKSAATLPSL